MIRRSFPPLLVVALMAAGCSTTVPVSVSTSKMKDDRGVAVTTNYTGTIRTASCTGSFTGAVAAGGATAALSCSGARSGYGTVTIVDGALEGGTIPLSDGTTARIVRLPNTPTPATPSGQSWGIFGPAVDLYHWGSQFGRSPS